MVYTAKYTDATSVYLKSGLLVTDKDVTSNESQLINEAETELEVLTGRKFTTSISVTEYFDAPKKDIVGLSGTFANSVRVTNYPILTVTEVKLLNVDGSVSKTYASTDYWLETQIDPLTNAVINNGLIRLKTDTFPAGYQNIKVAYTYGYASVPQEVKTLACCLSAIRLWVSFLGGCYNRIDSYSIPQQNVSKGDFYARGKQMIETLREEAERLLDRIGRRPRILFFATGSDR